LDVENYQATQVSFGLHNKVPQNGITSRHPKRRGQVSITTKVSGTGTRLEEDMKFDHEEKV